MATEEQEPQELDDDELFDLIGAVAAGIGVAKDEGFFQPPVRTTDAVEDAAAKLADSSARGRRRAAHPSRPRRQAPVRISPPCLPAGPLRHPTRSEGLMSVTATPARTHGATSPLRSRPAVRRFLEGPPLDPADLSMVLLVTEEESDRPMPTLTVAQLPARVRQAKQLGIRSVKIFAESTQRDAAGEFSVVPDALMTRAVRTAKDAEPEIAVMTETCLCSYTDTGFATSPTGRDARTSPPHRNLRPRPRRLPGRRARDRGGDDLLDSDAAAVRSQDRAHSPAGDRPLLPFLLGRGQLGLDAIGFLTQPLDTTTSSELVLFQQADPRRHPRPPGERRHDTPPLPLNHRPYA
ncbi:hypothetical protein PV963_20815 [Streptomyces coeruleorubidus]|nr:hypothetical protein [Streptomyces coeruleorubidus]WDV52641.1 hypothetical protein PV963_20815 [Streptomyces coeruleorubidus]